LPDWVAAFNSRELAQEYLSESWETLHPVENYTASIDDDNPYERRFADDIPPVFPHNLPLLMSDYDYGTELLSSTPFSDKLLVEFALEAIEGERLGSGPATDVLAISFSALDAIGHRFGPASVEVQDAFLRLDQYIAQLLTFLDSKFGKENILLFLTSDHGAPHVPEYLTSAGIPGGYVDLTEIEKDIRRLLEDIYDRDFLLSISNFQLYFDHDVIDQMGVSHTEIQKSVARYILAMEGIGGVLTADALTYNEFTKGIKGWVQNGYHQKRSGDVMFWLEPHTNRGTEYRGTDHNSPWVYDTHAPLYWYGLSILPGRSSVPVDISDIASTVSEFLNSPLPSGNTGKPMNRYMK
jgi:hypothetical protein